jgi:hypothetical protein
MLLSFSNSSLPLFCSKELAKTDNGIYELSFGNTHKRCRLQINQFRPSAALQVASAPQFSGFKAWMGLHTAPSTSVFFSSYCFVWELLCYRQTTTKQRLAGGLHQHPLLVGQEGLHQPGILGTLIGGDHDTGSKQQVSIWTAK